MLKSTFWKKSNSYKWLGTIFRFIVQNTGKKCVNLLVFIILRWSFNYESNVFRYNKILIDCVFGNSKFVVPSTLTIQCLGDNKLPIPSYPVNKYIIWTGPSPKKYYMDRSFWASEVHIIFFWWRTGPYTAIWPEVTWTICYIILII